MLEGMGLIVGHLVGDYILQNDWMAKNKTNPHPGHKPYPTESITLGYEYLKNRRSYWLGHLACSTHCWAYTLAVWAFSYWWMPWWGLMIMGMVHFPIDRWRLAKVWMEKVAGQSYFASKEHPLYPWSIVVVDNTFHIVTLFIVGAIVLCLR